MLFSSYFFLKAHISIIPPHPWEFNHLDPEPGPTLDGLEVFLEGDVGGHLEGAGAGHDAPVLQGVLHGPQTIPDSILTITKCCQFRNCRVTKKFNLVSY